MVINTNRSCHHHDAAGGKAGILVISHGSREAAWVKLVDEAVAAAAHAVSRRHSGEKSAELPVVSAYLEIVEGRLIQDGIDELEAEGVTELYVLPFFVSSGSTHVDDIAQAFGMPPVTPERPGELEPFRLATSTQVTFGHPISDDPGIAQLLLENIAELSSDPEREGLLLIAHGASEPVFYERWHGGLMQLAEQMRSIGGFAAADAALLRPDQAAERLQKLAHSLNEHEYGSIIVVPLFISEGYFTNTVIPSRLQGLNYRYNGRALLPHPRMVSWLSQQAAVWLDQREEARGAVEVLEVPWQ